MLKDSTADTKFYNIFNYIFSGFFSFELQDINLLLQLIYLPYVQINFTSITV